MTNRKKRQSAASTIGSERELLIVERELLIAERDALKRLLDEQSTAIALLLRTPPTVWYVNDPEEGVQLFNTSTEAEAHCRSVLADFADLAGDDGGWHENIKSLSWGYMVACGEVHEIDRIDAEDDPDIAEKGWDYQCSYELRPAADPPYAAPTAEQIREAEEALAAAMVAEVGP